MIPVRYLYSTLHYFIILVWIDLVSVWTWSPADADSCVLQRDCRPAQHRVGFFTDLFNVAFNVASRETDVALARKTLSNWSTVVRFSYRYNAER